MGSRVDILLCDAQAVGHSHTCIHVYQVMDATNGTRSGFIMCDWIVVNKAMKRSA